MSNRSANDIINASQALMLIRHWAGKHEALGDGPGCVSTLGMLCALLGVWG